ncbi:hypothetical protein [Kutzneria albida]|uniref:Uncharacterized protein n=1 Tax=Kutzneria albida DSM 43870 TaxID=1449976 RepID=W5WBW7_9PSEU|nr:hypothetical protein [Kutzneria albida]AHH98245.1 hypothetical protein KALB_4883 [Kutzneria albida DSM 43870]
MSNETVWDMQDQFDNATTDQEREQVRQKIADAGFSGVAKTIGRSKN